MNDNDPTPNSPEDLGWTPTATAREPLRFPIPAGTPQKSCRSCDAPMFWIVTATGRRMPVDPDGTSHFATCPNANDHRRPRLTQAHFRVLRSAERGEVPGDALATALEECRRWELVHASRCMLTPSGAKALAISRAR